jgi:hypothetical protein
MVGFYYVLPGLLLSGQGLPLFPTQAAITKYIFLSTPMQKSTVMATNSISGVQCVGSANIVSARYSANLYQNQIEINRFPTQQAYIVITTPYLCAARSRFDSQLAHRLLKEIFHEFFRSVP